MITSNINEILYKVEQNEQNSRKQDGLFANKVNSSLKETNSDKTNELTYENIKGMSIEQIDKIFTKKDDNQMAKNLRFATLFTSDEVLGRALFDTVLGKPFDIGYKYLTNRYEDKSIFLKSNKNTLSSLFHTYISDKNYGEKKVHEKISQNMLDDILLEVNSFNFLDSISNNSKNQYGKYKKDGNEEYSFLYNNHYLEYQELIANYNKKENEIKNILNQFK